MNEDLGRDSLVGGCVCVFPQAAWSPESCEGEGVKNESLMRILTLEVQAATERGGQLCGRFQAPLAAGWNRPEAGRAAARRSDERL